MIENYNDSYIWLVVDNLDSRKYTNATIKFFETMWARELTDLELNLLNWLSDDEVKEIVEKNWDVVFVDSDYEILGGVEV